MRLLLPFTCLLTTAALAAAPVCEGDSKARASRFSASALKGLTDAQRLDRFVKACALDEVVSLASKLISFETISEESPEAHTAAIGSMGKFLEEWAKAHQFAYTIPWLCA